MTGQTRQGVVPELTHLRCSHPAEEGGNFNAHRPVVAAVAAATVTVTAAATILEY